MIALVSEMTIAITSQCVDRLMAVGLTLPSSILPRWLWLPQWMPWPLPAPPPTAQHSASTWPPSARVTLQVIQTSYIPYTAQTISLWCRTSLRVFCHMLCDSMHLCASLQEYMKAPTTALLCIYMYMCTYPIILVPVLEPQTVSLCPSGQVPTSF